MSAGLLLTGVTGHICGRLLRRLEEGGSAVCCLARHPVAQYGTRYIRTRKADTDVDSAF